MGGECVAISVVHETAESVSVLFSVLFC